MNQINIKRLLLAGVVVFVSWIVIEVALEHIMSTLVFGQSTSEMWMQAVGLNELSGLSVGINLLVGLLNCIVMIWIYASLRPMYGVGTKTALITAAFGVVWILSMFVNITNLGLLPARLALIEGTFEAVEVPLAMLIGALVYEGRNEPASATE
jgi:hypothetical protein